MTNSRQHSAASLLLACRDDIVTMCSYPLPGCCNSRLACELDRRGSAKQRTCQARVGALYNYLTVGITRPVAAFPETPLCLLILLMLTPFLSSWLLVWIWHYPLSNRETDRDMPGEKALNRHEGCLHETGDDKTRQDREEEHGHGGVAMMSS